MAKTKMLCPFTNKLCDECAFYRGRHYYLSFCKQYRGYIGESKENAGSRILQQPVDFQALGRLIEPWSGTSDQAEGEPEIRLKVIDMENGKTRICELEEAKTWDWGNPEMMRVIDGFHITSWDRLLEFLRYKAGKGYREVGIYEAPRFILLGGG